MCQHAANLVTKGDYDVKQLFPLDWRNDCQNKKYLSSVNPTSKGLRITLLICGYFVGLK